MKDIETVLIRLSQSTFRRRFKLSEADRAYVARKSLDEIKEHARGFVAHRLAPAEPENDGKQTPMRGHPVFIAQHATATCCRQCLAKWHGIPAGQLMTPAQQAYTVDVIGHWLTVQVGPEIQRADAAEPRLF